MYAIIEACGKQYKVKEGDIVYFDKLESKDKKITFDKVLFVEGKPFGKPYLKATVEGEVLGDKKGEKITIFRYRPKNNWRKKQGHRQTYTAVKITKINA